MKNSLFKSYAKKILKSEAFISVIIVFALAIGIIGTSYALYMDVDTDTDYQLIDVGDLAISFVIGDNTISLTNMTPMDNDIALTKNDNLFSFYIYNTGNYTSEYNIKLVTLEGNQVDPQYINYQICINNAANCEDIKTLSNITNSIIYKDELAKKKSNESTNPSVYYFIRTWINNEYPKSQAASAVKLKVVVEAKNASGSLDNKNTLAGSIFNNENIAINNTNPDLTSIETNEVGMYKAKDDYGISYYFRGQQSNNYVKFAGFIWRVIRINGDGSVRIILNGTIADTKKEGSTTFAGGNSVYNSLTNDNTFVGYMYGIAGNNDYLESQKNVTDSSVKDVVDLFYENYLNTYSDYLADIIFCGDKTCKEGSLCTGTNDSFYKSASIDSMTKTFECAKGETNSFSRYTANELTTSTGVATNNDLEYPIGLISTQELVLAGFNRTNSNTTNYLLYKDGASWLTMTPNSYYLNLQASGIDMVSDGKIKGNTTNNQAEGVRPVINLKKDTVIKTGTGIITAPYVIK